MFIIPCKYVEGSHHPSMPQYTFMSSTLPTVITNINFHRPDDKIVIVDSFSDDDSYLKEVEKFPNVHIFEEKNKDYPPGAFFKVLNKFRDEKFYTLIHDSTNLKSSLDDYLDNGEQFYSFFKGNLEGLGVLMGTSRVGHVNYDYTSYTNQMFKDTGYVFQDFGSMVPCHHFVVKNKLANKILDTGIADNVFVEHKTQDNCWQYIFGMLFAQEGYPADKYYIAAPDYTKNRVGSPEEVQNEYFEKIYINRA